MKKQILTTIIISAAWASAMAQTTAAPRLVVGIMVDQLRSDYLNAFMPLYGEGGFKRLLDEGKICSNVQYQHAPVVRTAFKLLCRRQQIPWSVHVRLFITQALACEHHWR